MENEFDKIQKEVELSQKLKNEWGAISADKLSELDIPPSEFLIEKLVPLEGITILSGKPCAFKSWLLLLIGKQVALGKPFCGFETKQNKVLYIDEETSLAEIKRRWEMIKGEESVPIDFSSMKGFKIDSVQQREFLLNLAKESGYKLIIFDSLRDCHSRNENDSREAQVIVDAFRQLTQQGISVLISHHNRKESFLNPKDASQMLRGSDALLAGLDCLISVENPKNTEDSAELILTQSKLRQGKRTEPFKISVFESGGKMTFEYTGRVNTEETKLEETKIAVKDLLKEQGELYQKKIIEVLVPLYYSPRTIRRAISDLLTSKEIQPRVEGQKKFYSLGQWYKGREVAVSPTPWGEGDNSYREIVSKGQNSGHDKCR